MAPTPQDLVTTDRRLGEGILQRTRLEAHIGILIRRDVIVEEGVPFGRGETGAIHHERWRFEGRFIHVPLAVPVKVLEGDGRHATIARNPVATQVPATVHRVTGDSHVQREHGRHTCGLGVGGVDPEADFPGGFVNGHLVGGVPLDHAVQNACLDRDRCERKGVHKDRHVRELSDSIEGIVRLAAEGPCAEGAAGQEVSGNQIAGVGCHIIEPVPRDPVGKGHACHVRGQAVSNQIVGPPALQGVMADIQLVAPPGPAQAGQASEQTQLAAALDGPVLWQEDLAGEIPQLRVVEAENLSRESGLDARLERIAQSPVVPGEAEMADRLVPIALESTLNVVVGKALRACDLGLPVDADQIQGLGAGLQDPMPGEAEFEFPAAPPGRILGIHAGQAVAELPHWRALIQQVRPGDFLPPLPRGSEEDQPEIIGAELDRNVQEFVASIGPRGLESQEAPVLVDLHLPPRSQVPHEGALLLVGKVIGIEVGHQEARTDPGGRGEAHSRDHRVPELKLPRLHRPQQPPIGIRAAECETGFLQPTRVLEIRVALGAHPQQVPTQVGLALGEEGPLSKPGLGAVLKLKGLVHPGDVHEAVGVLQLLVALVLVRPLRDGPQQPAFPQPPRFHRQRLNALHVQDGSLIVPLDGQAEPLFQKARIHIDVVFVDLHLRSRVGRLLAVNESYTSGHV